MVRWSQLTALLLVGSIGFSAAACGGATGPTATPVVLIVTATPASQAAAPPSQPVAAPTVAAVKGESLKPADGTATAPNTTGTSGAPQGVSGGKQEVTALWVGQRGQGYAGGTSRVKVGVEKNDNKELRVGFFEEEVGGSGPMWRSAGWMAVIMSSLVLGAEPTNYRYTYEIGGYADGPSAGALMTIATLATMLGHTVKGDAAMTGTINPDGTIGPVGGIAHKVDGAAEAKKKLVLIPAGQRQSMDMNAQQAVDVIDRGRRLGVEVREVSDIYEAYELMTGQALPKPAGMKEIRPSLPGQSFERTKSKAKEWFTRYWQLQSQYAAQPGDTKFEATEALIADATAAGDKADSYYQQGLPSAAYNRSFTATLNASIALHLSKVVQTYTTSGLDAAIAYLDSMRSVNLKIDALIDRLGTQHASTLADVIAISESYGNINLALGLADLGNSALQREAKTEEEVLLKLTEATLMYALAEHLVETAKDSLDIGLGFGKAPAPSIEKVQMMSEVFRRAAEANLSYFENVVINEVAQGVGLHPTMVKARFQSQDMNYTFAISSLRAMSMLKERAGSGDSAAYAILGGALNSYVLSSVLVAKYYSLEAKVNEAGAIVEVKNERAMINMLDFAEKRSKEIIGLAESVGAEPVAPVISYEGAKIDREGDLDGKFNALLGFWSSALQGQMVGILSGKATIVK